ncbi:hypothetical protein HPB50_021467 [Hyalomma asiaticum]|uniref:Uncharacterized protein n=1 Tax=Hyalomma asiaticum TaxID=266040 RepID=A0ACB7RY70_HYAAI|nr:hypothetical protein HPB50_021467 [Hyalomma asiaticum]
MLISTVTGCLKLCILDASCVVCSVCLCPCVRERQRLQKGLGNLQEGIPGEATAQKLDMEAIPRRANPQTIASQLPGGNGTYDRGTIAAESQETSKASQRDHDFSAFGYEAAVVVPAKGKQISRQTKKKRESEPAGENPAGCRFCGSGGRRNIYGVLASPRPTCMLRRLAQRVERHRPPAGRYKLREERRRRACGDAFPPWQSSAYVRLRRRVRQPSGAHYNKKHENAAEQKEEDKTIKSERRDGGVERWERGGGGVLGG